MGSAAPPASPTSSSPAATASSPSSSSSSSPAGAEIALQSKESSSATAPAVEDDGDHPSLVSMFSERGSSFTVVVIGGAVVNKSSGRSEEDISRDVLMLSLSSTASTGWENPAKLPLRLSHHASTTLDDDTVVVCGGQGERSFFGQLPKLQETRLFSLKTRKWTTGPPLLGPRAQHALVRVGPVLFAVGGSVSSQSYTSTTEV